MNQGKYVFAQVMSFLPKHDFDLLVKKYYGNHRVRSFRCWDQLLCMLFGQITYRDGLRDIVLCLTSHQKKLYHLGIKGRAPRSTFADANEVRDYRIFEEFAQVLILQARELYFDDPEFDLDLNETAYAFDSTTIDLCLSVFPWAKFRSTKAAVKAHMLMDLKGSIPTWIYITTGKVSDMIAFDFLPIESGSIYVMDRGYIDFERLYRFQKTGAYFIIKARSDLQYRRQYSQEKNEPGILSDQIGVLTGFYPAKKYPQKLRRISVRDPETETEAIVLTNIFHLSAGTIGMLYRKRWNIELFFKWIKQHLKIKSFWGTSENAVKIQLWTAVICYCLVAIIRKKIRLKISVTEMLQVLAVSVFDKMPLSQLLLQSDLQFSEQEICNQLSIFDF